MDLLPTTTRPAPLPGHIMRSDERINASFRTRTAVSQIATATLVAGFDGARDLGFSYGGPVALGLDAASVGAWLTAVNAALVGQAVVTHNAGVVTVTSLDFVSRVLTAYNPAAPALTLSAFTYGTPAVAAPTVKAGMGVVWRDRALRTVQAPLANSTLLDYVGVVDRSCTLPDSLAPALSAGIVGAFTSGQTLLVHRRCTGFLFSPTGIVTGDPVYLGRLPTEAGNYYPVDDVDNTRLLIPAAQWMASGTGSVQAYFQ